jgi:hypothetical protein
VLEWLRASPYLPAVINSSKEELIMNKFKKPFGLAALSLLLALAPAVHAGTNTFDGNTFAVDYGASNGGTESFFSLAHADATGSASGVEVANHHPGI